MATIYDNIIASLNNIGNQVVANSDSSSQNMVNWSVDQFSDIIGWFTTIEKNVKFTIRTSPVSTGDNVYYLDHVDGREEATITVRLGNIELETEKGKIIDNMMTITYPLSYGGTAKQSTIIPDKDTTITPSNGPEIHISKNGTRAYYHYAQVFSYDSKHNETTGIPFYCWCETNNKLYFGLKLDLKSGSLSKKVNGWIEITTDDFNSKTIMTRIKGNIEDKKEKTVTEDYIPTDNDTEGGNTDTDAGDSNPEVHIDTTDAWENPQEYTDKLLAADSEAQMDYWKQLYGSDMGTYSLKSHRSIIGLPLQFMSNVDMRVGSSTYGKQFMEDILYDMSIACIKPGGPVLNPNLSEDAQYSDGFVTTALNNAGKFMAYMDSLKDKGFGETLKQYLFSLFKGGSARFYSFQSDYTHYTHYVNTLCHLFITYLNIGEKEYTLPNKSKKKYAFYDDSPREIETDEGLGLHHQFGWDNAVYVYYSPESQLSHTFSNSTQASTLNNTLMEASNAVKEWGFFINAAGLESTGRAVSSFTQDLVANANNGGLLGRLFGNATEGIATVLAGNNISLPDIYSDSETTVQHTFKIKLASPYGDPESVFLYVLRPLARLLAFSLPRQYGPNSYMSPFIVQAFSKGQFNCQLGIVTNLSITRCGNGGESHTINHIPTELEVTLEIADMYEKVFLSNEYFGNSAMKVLAGAGIDLLTGGLENVGKGAGTLMTQFGTTLTASRLLFNNVGLIDFVASFCGANLNQPTYMTGWTVIYNMMKNRSADIISYTENDGWKFPQWEKHLNDAYNDAVTKLTSSITTIA